MNTATIRRNTLLEAPLWVHAITWGTFGALTLILLALYFYYQETDVWFLWLGHPLPENHVFNEATRASIFRTPANTWTNLAYVLAGIYIAAYAWWDARRDASESDPYAVRQPALMGLLGIACIILGFGSGAMHAALMGWGHKLDVFGMYISMSTLIALQWARWLPSLPFTNGQWQAWPVFAVAAIAASLGLLEYVRRYGDGDIIMMLLIALAIGTATIDVLFGKTSLQLPWCLLALASVGIAYYIWRLDVAGQFSAPESWFQGHAIWHILTAIALLSMAVFYRTEVPAASMGIARFMRRATT